MKILIVEHQENLARMIQDGLTAEGFTSEYVLDGRLARARLKYSPEDYDLIVLDTNYSKNVDVEFCSYCRNKNNKIKILVLSATDDPEERINSLNSGVDDYLAKPFSFDSLLNHIKSVLRKS